MRAASEGLGSCALRDMLCYRGAFSLSLIPSVVGDMLSLSLLRGAFGLRKPRPVVFHLNVRVPPPLTQPQENQ